MTEFEKKVTEAFIDALMDLALEGEDILRNSPPGAIAHAGRIAAVAAVAVFNMTNDTDASDGQLQA